METKKDRRHVLSILVADTPQELARVIGLISARGFNISLLTVGMAFSETEEEYPLSCITILTTCDDDTIAHMRDQMEKMVNVLSAQILTDDPRLVLADVTLVKVFVSDPQQQAIALQIAQGMRGFSIITLPEYILFRFIGRTDASDFILSMKRFGKVKSVTSGTVALA
jgi:acetolactate synthase-1/3 small subunit